MQLLLEQLILIITIVLINNRKIVRLSKIIRLHCQWLPFMDIIITIDSHFRHLHDLMDITNDSLVFLLVLLLCTIVLINHDVYKL